MGRSGTVSCNQCDYQENVILGSLMSNCDTTTYAPFACQDCDTIITRNVRQYADIHCANCNSQNVKALFNIEPKSYKTKAEKHSFIHHFKQYFGKKQLRPMIYRLPFDLDDNPEEYVESCSFRLNQKIDDFDYYDIHIKNNQFECPKCKAGKLYFKYNILVD